MIDYIGKVREFHNILGRPIGDHPQLIDQEGFARRMRLICEELSEYSTAVGCEDLVEIADALGDLLYVVFGTAVEHGLPMDGIFNEIHLSNMTKKDGHEDSSGKWIKPSNYVPVDLSWVGRELI